MATEYPPHDKKFRISELKLGDVLEMFDGPYSTATVIQATDESVKVFRAYIHVNETEYTQGLIPYFGHEEVTFFRTCSCTFRVYKRVDIA